MDARKHDRRFPSRWHQPMVHRRVSETLTTTQKTNMESLQSYAGRELVACHSAPRQLSVREQLESQKASLNEKLKTIDAAIAALDENPGVEKVLTLVGRAVRF